MPNHRSTHQLLCLLMLAHVVELDQIYPVLASLSCLTVVNSHVEADIKMALLKQRGSEKRHGHFY